MSLSLHRTIIFIFRSGRYIICYHTRTRTRYTPPPPSQFHTSVLYLQDSKSTLVASKSDGMLQIRTSKSDRYRITTFVMSLHDVGVGNVVLAIQNHQDGSGRLFG